MLRAIDEDRPTTPLGPVSVGMSCGLATGAQAFHLVGASRRALVVAGPVSTEMAPTRGGGTEGQAFLSVRLAAALPSAWRHRLGDSGHWRLRRGAVLDAAADVSHVASSSARRRPSGVDPTDLLPVQLRSLADLGRLPGELKQVAIGFVRLDGTDAVLVSDGAQALHDRLAAMTALVERQSAPTWTCVGSRRRSMPTPCDGCSSPACRRRPSTMRIGCCGRYGASPTTRRRRCASAPSSVSSSPATWVIRRRCTYVVIGDTTNVAARLTTKAGPGELVAGQRLVDAGGARFETAPFEPFTVKGRRGLVRACLVGALADEALGRPIDVGIVGRAAEQHDLLTALAAGGIVELVGEPGVGKTSLWQATRAATTGEREWVTMRAEPHEMTTPFAPIARLLRRSAGIGGASGGERRRARCAGW